MDFHAHHMPDKTVLSTDGCHRRMAGKDPKILPSLGKMEPGLT